jgi:hypothetical protein
MSQRFRNGSRQFAGAVILATVLAGVACIATSGLANVAKFATTSVDRTHKGDRLSPASNLARPADKSKTAKVPTIVPAGCDPAFSPFADPYRGQTADVLHDFIPPESERWN